MSMKSKTETNNQNRIGELLTNNKNKKIVGIRSYKLRRRDKNEPSHFSKVVQTAETTTESMANFAARPKKKSCKHLT